MPEVDEAVYFNGIDLTSGSYATPPVARSQLEAEIFQKHEEPENIAELRFRHRRATIHPLGVREGVDAEQVQEAGWGVIFAHDADPAVREALTPLLNLRAEQAGKFYHCFDGEHGFQPDDTKNSFLVRNGGGVGAADPEKVPYYLLIVGSPAKIPFSFQSQLDVVYAVGRIHFNTLQEYASYAQSVVDAEEGRVRLPRSAAFFSASHPEDRATLQSTADLAQPLAKSFHESHSGWSGSVDIAEAASRDRLEELLGGAETPALLFAAGHGALRQSGDSRQLCHQGAFICSDWPGPKKWKHGQIPERYIFAGNHIAADASLLGTIAFFFACFGGGTPQFEQYSKLEMRDAPLQIAPHPFLAHLPTRMLGHPRGGALAVVAHVDRAFNYGYRWGGTSQISHFEDAFKRLVRGVPVGHAFEFFNDRYAELATMVADAVETGDARLAGELVRLWTAHNDARGYAIIGDPAVRLPIARDGADQEEERPVVTVSEVKGVPTNDVQEVDCGEAQETEPGDVVEVPAPPREDTAREGQSSVRRGHMLDEPLPFSPRPVPGPKPDGMSDEAYQEMTAALMKAWVENVAADYRNNHEIFQRVLNAFMRSHYSTLIMYWILFVVGIGFFAIAVYLALLEGQAIAGAIFGGLGVVAFLSFFIARSTQSVEENLQFIAWLGIIYNSYWTKLAWTAFEEVDAQDVVDQATDDAIARLNKLIDKHAHLVRRRPSLRQEEAEDGGEG
ncbi:MAG: hypothetical protein R3272_12895 [Candidatus Promineifilaceae bacterium]|nr:hypothetical protein [Candidatus Promineifilaceae bacterium]